jgi:hypothetical protein
MQATRLPLQKTCYRHSEAATKRSRGCCSHVRLRRMSPCCRNWPTSWERLDTRHGGQAMRRLQRLWQDHQSPITLKLGSRPRVRRRTRPGSDSGRSSRRRCSRRSSSGCRCSCRRWRHRRCNCSRRCSCRRWSWPRRGDTEGAASGRTVLETPIPGNNADPHVSNPR